MIGYCLFIAAVSIAIATISYPGFARAKRWPVGTILAADASIPKIVAFIAIAWALAKAFFVFQWWSPLMILPLGWLLAVALTLTLKRNTQALAILGAFPAYLLIVLYESEQRPLGFLNAFF